MLPCILAGESQRGSLKTSDLAPVSHSLAQLACLQRRTCLFRGWIIALALQLSRRGLLNGKASLASDKSSSLLTAAHILQHVTSHRHTWLMRWCRSSCEAALALRLSGRGLLNTESPLSLSGLEQQSLGCIGSSSRGASLRSSACCTYKARQSSCIHGPCKKP